MIMSPRTSMAAAGVLLACAATLAVAQTAPVKPGTKPAAKPAASPAGKTLGGKTAGGGKLMSREELRSCLSRLDEINQSAKDIEGQRPQLDRERDELKAAGVALAAERAEVDRQLLAVREWEGRMRAHAVEIEAFNRRNGTAADAPRNQQEKIFEELKGDRERLNKTREALGVDEARVVPSYQAMAKTYNERATARDAKVLDWNARSAAATESSVRRQEAHALWLNECANRPYLEDDEKAIKAGK